MRRRQSVRYHPPNCPFTIDMTNRQRLMPPTDKPYPIVMNQTYFLNPTLLKTRATNNMIHHCSGNISFPPSAAPSAAPDSPEKFTKIQVNLFYMHRRFLSNGNGSESSKNPQTSFGHKKAGSTLLPAHLFV
jgi:hypothetical protein